MTDNILVEVSEEIQSFLCRRLEEQALAVGMDVAPPDPFNAAGLLDVDKLASVLRAMGSDVDLFNRDAPAIITTALKEVKLVRYEPGDSAKVAAFSHRIARNADDPVIS